MIFKRRDRPSPLSRLRLLVQPRKGWRRGFAYVGRRVQRLPDTPHRIALGFACGAMASFTPLFTLHIVAGCALAFLMRANLIAAALGTAVGNPFTFPAIAGVSLWIGGWMLGGGDAVASFDMSTIFSDFDAFLDRIFLPYLVGGLAPGLVTSAACYAAVRPVVAAYQNRRRNRLMEAASRRVHDRLSRRRLKTNPAPDPSD